MLTELIRHNFILYNLKLLFLEGVPFIRKESSTDYAKSNVFLSWKLFLISGSADSGVGSPWPRMNLHEGHHRYQHQHLLHSDSLGPRERVVQEIVNTEAIYVQDLGQIIQVSPCLSIPSCH